MKRNMSTSMYRTFVTLDDIDLTGIEEMNYVIFNPTKIRSDTGAKILHRQMLERYQIDLPTEILHELMLYDVEHLDQFVERLREVIQYYKNQ